MHIYQLLLIMVLLIMVLFCNYIVDYINIKTLNSMGYSDYVKEMEKVRYFGFSNIFMIGILVCIAIVLISFFELDFFWNHLILVFVVISNAYIVISTNSKASKLRKSHSITPEVKAEVKKRMKQELKFWKVK